MCAVYAEIIREEVQSDETDVRIVLEMCENIERYCQTVAFAPGETPEHLEPYLFDGE
jgi:hypothetical protein